MKSYFKIPFITFVKLSIKNGVAVGITSFVLIFLSFIFLNLSPDNLFGWIIYTLICLFGASLGGIITIFLTASFFCLSNSRYPVEISSDGLSSFDNQRNKVFIGWDEFTGISIESYDNSSFFAFKNHLDKEIFVPLSIKDKYQFMELVSDYSERLNPEFSQTFKDFIQDYEATT